MMRLTNPQFPHFLQKADVLRRSGSLCDAVIAVKNHTFHAHRLVLACASTTLAQQLSREQQCTLQLLSPHTFQLVLDFIYSQTLDVSQDDLQLLLRAAQILQMETLEEQCRKQINTLQHSHHRKEKKAITEEKQAVIETNQKEDNLQDLKHAPENTKDCKESLDCESEKNPQSPKRLRPSPTTTQSNRDSVITSSSFSSPWTIPANMWNSVDTLRQIAHNYSTLMSAHSVQSPNQALTCPFTVSSRHMFPFIPSSFQKPVQSSVMAYSRLHPHFSPYTGPTRVGSIIRQGLLKRRKQKTEATAPQPSYMDVAQTDKGKSQNCQYCATRLLNDPASQQSTKTGCRSCGRTVSHQQEHRLDKPYHCKHCSKKFSLKHQLDTHHRVHTGEKPFECRLCGQRSRDYSAMIKHLRTHGGAAPYQCTVCLEYCSSLVAMQRHVKSHSVQDFPSDWSISSTYLYRSHI